VRFASDGALAHIRFPAWDGVTPKHEIIKKFFTYVRGELPGARISADLFGLATVNPDDLGIGQVIEDGYQNFDFISPMVYPSHYAGGFLGYKNPASFPYEIIQYSIQTALSRLQGEWPRLVTPVANTSTPQASGTVVNATTSPSSPVYHAGLRPWLQDFNLGATYNAEMVRKEIQATEEVLSTAHSSSSFAGWLLWNASNVYTEAALRKE